MVADTVVCFVQVGLRACQEEAVESVERMSRGRLLRVTGTVYKKDLSPTVVLWTEGNNNNNNDFYIALYPVKSDELTALYNSRYINTTT